MVTPVIGDEKKNLKDSMGGPSITGLVELGAYLFKHDMISNTLP